MTFVKWNRSSIRLGLAVFAGLAILAFYVERTGAQQRGAAGGQQAQGGQRGGGAVRGGVDDVLVGTIDVHAHQAPDNRARSIDFLDAARYAKLKGMRGLVLKSHLDPTAGYAYIARKEVPGLEVFGLLDLNLPVGGINPHAVEHFVQVTGPGAPPEGYGRVVMMSSEDSEYQVNYSKENRESVHVSRTGELLPAVKEVIGLIKKYNLTLSTGHNSPDESVMIVREAIRQGIPPTRIGVTHANLDPPGLDIPHMQEVAKMGAFVELCGQSQRPSATLDARNDRLADIIRKVGPANIIMETDLGQANNEYHADGLAGFIRAMRARGITAQETDMMTKRNPARYLGISEPPAAASN